MKSAVRLPRALMNNLVVRNLDDETLIYDPERDQAHCLNLSAALVWRQCDGKTTATQAARTLERELGARVDSDFVWLAVKQLQKFHLVQNQNSIPSVSRRDLIRKYAPAALALPVIMSISAPALGQAASCGSLGAPCGGTLPKCCPNLFCFGSPSKCNLG